MSLIEVDYGDVGGRSNKIDATIVSSSFPRQSGNHLICDLYSDSTGTLDFSSSGYSSQWSVSGQTVTKISGTATTIAYLVQDGQLYIGTPTGSGSEAYYSGTLTSITIPDDSEFKISLSKKTS